MGVTNTNAYDGPFYPNGVTTSFPFTFRTMSTNEVAIVGEDGSIITGFSFSIVPATGADGGTIVFDTPPTEAQLPAFLIASAPDFGVGIDLGSVTAFNPRTLNPSFERLAVQGIFLNDRLSRTLQFRLGESGGTLPSSSERALKYLGFDNEGNPSPLVGVVDLVANEALGIPAGDTDLGTGFGPIVPPNPTAKEAIAAVETGILDRVTFIDGIVANNPAAAAANSAKVQAAFDSVGIIPSNELVRFKFRSDLAGTVYLAASHTKSGVDFDQGQVTLSGGDVYPEKKRRVEGRGEVELITNQSVNKNQWETFGKFTRVEVSGGTIGYGKRFLFIRHDPITTGADTFDVAHSVQSYHGGDLNGAIALLHWDIATLGPQSGGNPSYQFGMGEHNPVNMDRAPGITDYLSSWYVTSRKTFAHIVVPESRDFTGYQPGNDGHSILAAFVVGRSGALSPIGGKYAQVSAPFMAIEDAVTAGGAAFVAKGATSSGGINGDGIPLAHFLGRNRAQIGIDLTGSPFSSAFAVKFDGSHRVGCDAAYTIYDESGQKGISNFKVRDSVIARRHEDLDVGGAESDTGGAYYRGKWSFGPTYTVSGSPSFPAMVEYAQYDTLTDPTYRRWRRSTPAGHRSQFVVDGSTVWMDYDPSANLLDITAPTKLPRYLTSSLPSAAVYQDAAILVTNAAAGRTICISNGTNWCPSGSTTPVS